jgi:hypothetical protein
MASVYVDDQPVPVAQSMQTWADVLTSIDRDLDARGRVVANVRFDGVDEPTYREASTLARPLSRVGCIDLLTATPEAFLKMCLRDAVGSVRRLGDISSRTADLFRTSDLTGANEGLAAVAGELGQMMTLVGTLQGPLGVSTARSEADAVLQGEEMGRLSVMVDALLRAQRSGDAYAVADLLEYDLAPVLRAWETRFEALAA